MTNQDIYNNLATLEAVFYYRLDGHDNREGVKYADLEFLYNMIRAACEEWHSLTGCTLTD